MDLALRHLGGLARGLEIGASAINPFPGLRPWNLDHPAEQLFQAAQEQARGRAQRIDVFGDGQRLPLATGALDYLLASHVLEHMPDLLRCLREWSRAVRPGGVVFLIVPHRDRTFDRARPRTTLEHHLADYALGKTARTSPMVPSSHYHVWVTADLVGIVERLCAWRWIDWELLDVEDVDSKVGNGFTLVARVRSHPPLPRGVAPGPPDRTFCHWTLRYPFQVPARTVEFVTPSAAAAPGLPRGRYRVAEIEPGLPPAVRRTEERVVGDPVPAPVLEEARVEAGALRLAGRGLTESGYLWARLPDGRVEGVLPEVAAGAWSVALEGLVLPTEPFDVVPVNLPPGGGAGPPRRLDPEHWTGVPAGATGAEASRGEDSAASRPPGPPAVG